MATDTKKPSVDETPPVIKIGDDKGITAPRRIKSVPLLHARKGTVILLAIILLLIAGFALYRVEVAHKVLAQAAGHKIYKADVDKLIGNNKHVSEHDAATVLANKYLTQAMAKDQSVTVSDQDLVAAYGPVINTLKKDNQYSYQLQVNQLYFDKLQTYNQGVYKGYLLVAHFSRNIVLQPDASGDTNTDPAAVAADKKYAQDFITNLYNQINAGKITWDQAAQMQQADPIIGLRMYPSLSQSGPFDTSKAPVSLFTPSSAQQQLRTMKPGQTSKPFVVKVTNTVGNKNQTFESYFLVVKMDSSSGGKSSANFQQELQQAKKQFGYKVNV